MKKNEFVMPMDEIQSLGGELADAVVYEDDKMVPSGEGTEAGFCKFRRPRSDRGFYDVMRCRCCREVNGTRYLCKYELRQDHWEENFSRGWVIQAGRKRRGLGAHSHEWPQPGLETFLQERPVRPSVNLACPALYEKMAVFAAQRNIALDKIVSREFFEIIWAAGDFMIQAQRNGLVLAENTTSDFLKKVGVDRIRQLMITTSEHKVTEALEEFSTKKYVCVCLDAGQVRRRHWLDFIVCHGHKEVPFDIQDTGNLDTKQYCLRAVSLLQKLHALDIRVACFVGDGLPAQVNALDSMKPTSFQRSFRLEQLGGIAEFRKVMFFPCWIHRIQLVFKHVYANSKQEGTYFHQLVDNLHLLASRLRKPDVSRILGLVCPAPIETRWLFSYDVARFVWNHIHKIREVLGTESKTFDLAIGASYHLHKLLAPLRALTLALSRKGALACEVFPLVQSALRALRRIETSDELKPFRDEIIEDLMNQTIQSPQGDMLIAAFYMTLSGKDDYRPSTVQNRLGITAPRIRLPELDPDSTAQADILSQKLVGLEEEDQADPEGIQQEPIVEDARDSSDDDDEIPLPGEETPGTQPEAEPRAAAVALPEAIEGRYALAGIDTRVERGVLAWAKRARVKREEAVRAWNQLYAFLNRGIKQIPRYTLLSSGPETFWNSNSDCGEFMEIAKIAERVVIIPASEISCERAISLQGYVQTKYNGRSGTDLLTARLAHLCIAKGDQ